MALAVFHSAAFSNASGLAVAAGAAVEVRDEATSNLATIYEDRDGNTAITQPGFVADANGRFEFYATGGAYSVEVDDGVNSYTLRYVAIGLAAEYDASAYGATIMDADDAAAARTLLDVYSEAEADAAAEDAAEAAVAAIPTAGEGSPPATGLIALATQIEQEAGSGDNAVTPSVQHFHPSAAKVWLAYNQQTPAILADYGVSSVTDNATGLFTVNFDTAFSSANYVLGASYSGTDGTLYVPHIIEANRATGSVQILTEGVSGTNADLAYSGIVIYGDH